MRSKAMGQIDKQNANPIPARWDKLRSWAKLKEDIEHKLESTDKNSGAITLEIGPQLMHTLRHPSCLVCTNHFTSKLGEVFTTHYNRGSIQMIKVWTLETNKGTDSGTLKHDLIETVYTIMSMVYVSKHRVYLVFCSDLLLRIFTDKFAEVFAMPCTSTMLCLVYNKDDDEIYAGGVGFVVEWKVHGAEHAASVVPGRKFLTDLTRDEWISDIKIDKLNNQIFAMHSDGICVISLKTRKQIGKVPSQHEGPLQCCCYYPLADYLITGGADGKIKVFNGQAFNLIHIFIGHHGPVSGVEAHQEDNLLFSCSFDGTIRLWRIDSYQIFMRVDLGERIFNLSLLSKTEFYCQTDKDILIYNVNQFYEMFVSVESETKKLLCCRGKGKASRILGSTEDGSVRLFSPVTGLTLTIMFPMPSFQVLTSFAYDLHKNRLLTVIQQGQVLVYNTATNPCKVEEIWRPKHIDEKVENLLLVTVELEGDEGTVMDTLVLAGLVNGQIIVCDAGICLQDTPIQAHEGSFTCLEACQHLNPAGTDILETTKIIVSGGTDKYVKLWSLSVSVDFKKPVVKITSMMNIYLSSIPSHVCMCCNNLSLSIKTNTKKGPRWILMMYKIMEVKKKWSSKAPFMPVEMTHAPSEDHTDELTALDKSALMKIVLTAGKDGFVKIWNNMNELLREMNFLTPVYASCFANNRADVLVGYGAHICSVSSVNYLPLDNLRSLVETIDQIKPKEDERELPVKFDNTCEPWLDLNKVKKYTIFNRRRQHLEEEVIERLRRPIEKEKEDKYVVFNDGGTRKVIRKDFADRLLNWAKGSNKLPIAKKAFGKAFAKGDKQLQDSPGNQTKDVRKVARGIKRSLIEEDQEESDCEDLQGAEFLNSEGLLQLYPSTVGHALRALGRGSVSSEEEMRLLQEKELLKKDPIIAPDGYIPNSVIRRKLKPLKGPDPVMKSPFRLKEVPHVNKKHLPSWWAEEAEKEKMIAKEEETREFVVTKWEDTPSPTQRSEEVISSISTVSLDSFIESPVKKYIQEGRGISPGTSKQGPGASSRADRSSKGGGSVSRDTDQTPVDNVKKMIKLNNKNVDSRKKKVYDRRHAKRDTRTFSKSVAQDQLSRQ